MLQEVINKYFVIFIIATISDNDIEKLPICECNHNTKAIYYCSERCPGPKYYCDEFCANRKQHNHLPDKIVHLVREIEFKWNNLLRDINQVEEVSTAAYQPYVNVGNSLETLADSLGITLDQKMDKAFSEIKA